MPKTFTFQDYFDKLENAGPAYKEMLLDDAAKNRNINPSEFAGLMARAYPDQY